MRIGITGQAGFIGTHLFNTLSLHQETFQPVPFQDEYFDSQASMDAFVSQCDVIVHLAAMNRHADAEVLYQTNIDLVKKLIGAMERCQVLPRVIMSSSLQEERDNPYGRSKRIGRELLQDWAGRNGAEFLGLIIPNVFGPFGVPFYNSVISTFSHQLVSGDQPKIEIDAELKLIYIDELVRRILDFCRHGHALGSEAGKEGGIRVEHQYQLNVTGILEKLNHFTRLYLQQGVFPDLSDSFDLNLFNTFRSYLPITFFPRSYAKHSDARGDFIEITKAMTTGQSSISTTVPGITRGNHFHTRKVERFSVVKGKALIKLRKFNSTQVYELVVDGSEPGYVDIPVWYTHNLSNIGSDELLTMFWINEFYDPADPDTYFEEV